MSTLSNPTSTAEKEKLLGLLRESRQRFLGSFEGITEEQCRCHPSEGQWSVLDTVEHLALAESLMFKLISNTRRPRPANAPNREDIFLRVVADRSRKSQAPEGGRPRGSFASLDAAAAQFKTARESTMKFVEDSSEDLRATEVTHPHPAAGAVSTYEMVIIMAKHAERHALQIEEIRGSLVTTKAND
jgi:uncharacterized damage-inducible protein DinB